MGLACSQRALGNGCEMVLSLDQEAPNDFPSSFEFTMVGLQLCGSILAEHLKYPRTCLEIQTPRQDSSDA